MRDEFMTAKKIFFAHHHHTKSIKKYEWCIMCLLHVDDNMRQRDDNNDDDGDEERKRDFFCGRTRSLLAYNCICPRLCVMKKEHHTTNDHIIIYACAKAIQKTIIKNTQYIYVCSIGRLGDDDGSNVLHNPSYCRKGARASYLNIYE